VLILQPAGSLLTDHPSSLGLGIILVDLPRPFQWNKLWGVFPIKYSIATERMTIPTAGAANFPAYKMDVSIGHQQHS